MTSVQIQITQGPLCVLETFWATVQPKLCVRVSINFEVRYVSSPALTALLTAHELAIHCGTCLHRDRRLQHQTPSQLQLQLFQLLLSQGWQVSATAAVLASTTAALLVRQYVQGFFLSRHIRTLYVCASAKGHDSWLPLTAGLLPEESFFFFLSPHFDIFRQFSFAEFSVILSAQLARSNKKCA